VRWIHWRAVACLPNPKHADISVLETTSSRLGTGGKGGVIDFLPAPVVADLRQRAAGLTEPDMSWATPSSSRDIIGKNARLREGRRRKGNGALGALEESSARRGTERDVFADCGGTPQRKARGDGGGPGGPQPAFALSLEGVFCSSDSAFEKSRPGLLIIVFDVIIDDEIIENEYLIYKNIFLNI